MKDYLRALDALKRMCKLLQQGAQIERSTTKYFVDEVIKQFKMQFGEEGSAAKVLKLLTEANNAIEAGRIEVALLRITQADILL